ncbi:kinesin-associated protein-domain-containing protein [Pavlovales sp. CCMP2436]|nr:kinesin-associated protein-domain-containing protein [Pavlovales sp. CCMP2436]
MENARFMKRKVKAGAIEVDRESTRPPSLRPVSAARRPAPGLTRYWWPRKSPTLYACAACTLIVNYEVEATVLGDLGEPIVAERKVNQKRIRLKTLDEHTDIPRLVEEILQSVKLIPESKRALVQQLLYDLQRHQQHGGPLRSRSASVAAGAGASGRDSAGTPVQEEREEKASLEALGEYIDGCYEGVEGALSATGLLLQLAREPTNLEPLAQDDRLLGCLTRLLNDEGKRSLDLAVNIVSVLYALSAYSDFHPALLEFKSGSLVMDVVDLEIKRHALRERERAQAGSTEPNPEEERRDKLRRRKQEKVLYVSFHVLLNLAEDINTERKMCNHGIVQMLTAMLSRHNGDLLILTLAFLKKLSIFGENAGEMAKAHLADRLVAFVPNKHEGVLEQVLHLLFNLSFHPKCNAQLGRAGLAPKLLALLRKGR